MDTCTHLVHRWVQGKELCLPISPAGLFVLLLEVLGAHELQQVFQPLVRLQTAEVKATGREGAFPRHIAQHV